MYLLIWHADDTTLYYIHTSQNTIEQNLQVALNQLHIWCKNNGMILNSAKTKVMFVKTKKKRQRLDDNLNLLYNNDPLQTVTNDKILGIFVDNSLTWSDHIKHLTKKIVSNIWLLSKLSPPNHKLIVYNFTSLIFNLILTFVISHGAVHQKQTNIRT